MPMKFDCKSCHKSSYLLHKSQEFCSRQCSAQWHSKRKKAEFIDNFNNGVIPKPRVIELEPKPTVPQCICTAGFLNWKCFYNQLPPLPSELSS